MNRPDAPPGRRRYLRQEIKRKKAKEQRIEKEREREREREGGRYFGAAAIDLNRDS